MHEEAEEAKVLKADGGDGVSGGDREEFETTRGGVGGADNTTGRLLDDEFGEASAVL